MNTPALFALHLDGHGKGEPIAVPPPTTLTPPAAGLLWVHIDYTRHEAQDWLHHCALLEPVAVNSLLEESSRPRSLLFQTGLMLELRGVNLNPGAAPEDMVAVRLWLDKQLIISSNRRTMVALNEAMESLGQGKGPASSSDFVSFLVERIEENITRVIDQLEEEFEQLEDNLLAGEHEGLRAELSRLRRLAIRLHRYLGPQKDAIQHLLVEPPPWLERRARMHLREHLHRMSRLLEELDSIRDRAIIAQEEFLNHLSEQLNTRMYTLSLVATLFMPLGFLTGLLGINVGGIPGAGSQYGFLAVVLVITVLVGGQITYLRKKKWF